MKVSSNSSAMKAFAVVGTLFTCMYCQLFWSGNTYYHNRNNENEYINILDSRNEYLDFFISSVMNLQYNFYPGSIDGDVVPPNAVAVSMAGKRRLDNFAILVAIVIQEGTPGHVVETGSWRGGASFVAAKTIELLHEDHLRNVFICDSFKGIPAPPSDRRYNEEDHRANFPVFSEASASKVKSDALHFGLNMKHLVLVEGYFNESLPKLLVQEPDLQLAVLRLDGDTYFSTMDALRVLYPRLSQGGFVIVDDYVDWAGCREAVEDYRRVQGIYDPIVLVPHQAGEILRGVYWRKGSAAARCAVTGSASATLRGKGNSSSDNCNHNQASRRVNDSKRRMALCPGEEINKHSSVHSATLAGPLLLYPKTSYRPAKLIDVPPGGPTSLSYGKGVFDGIFGMKMCV